MTTSPKLRTALADTADGRQRNVYAGRVQVGNVLRVGSLPSCTRYYAALTDGTPSDPAWVDLGSHRTMRQAVEEIARALTARQDADQ